MQSDRSHLNKSSSQDELVDPRKTEEGFNICYPIGKGIGAGTLFTLFSATCFSSKKIHFRTGFLYGAIAGAFNLAITTGTGSQYYRNIADSNKWWVWPAVNAIPWVSSGVVMHVLHNKTSSYLFRINPALAIASAFAVQMLGYSDDDLLSDKTPRCTWFRL